MDRRDFLRTASVGAFATTGPVRLKPDTTDEGANDRDYWISVMRKLADPVLTNLANARASRDRARRGSVVARLHEHLAVREEQRARRDAAVQHLDRQRVSVRGRIASARTAVERRILHRAAQAVDVGESVGRDKRFRSTTRSDQRAALKGCATPDSV